jgi:tetratricopeptide (TPR) repeat protein
MTWDGTDMPIEQARKAMRLVLLHGTKDAYAASMKTDYESFMLDDFEHVTYLRIEGMGHTIPTANWLEKGLVALDRSKDVERPRKIMPATRSTKITFNSVKRPLPAQDPEKQAERVLNSGKSYFDNALFDGAVIAAQRVLDEYPQAPAAAEAKLLLDRVEFIKPLAVPYGQNTNTPLHSALFFARGAVNKNRHDAARLYLERVQTLSPDSPEAVEAKAWIEWMDRNASAAATKPSKPGNLAVIVFQSGLSYSSANLTDAARAAYERVISEFPKTPSATEARKLLAKMKSG